MLVAEKLQFNLCCSCLCVPEPMDVLQVSTIGLYSVPRSKGHRSMVFLKEWNTAETTMRPHLDCESFDRRSASATFRFYHRLSQTSNPSASTLSLLQI
ncbi:hypothetical protein PILCRDRAFT_168249 [Piloderma croceum F 1598]|uniref:Uncharacterized protein n=1 Tax=Piloderma croceum (strain F 1598) TaxID=765440 RepID=A0A0C3GHR3_PILCF|nr:hypothetical protein PILCRDRAFT_168249 [Piloderma croceum F 1598]